MANLIEIPGPLVPVFQCIICLEHVPVADGQAITPLMGFCTPCLEVLRQFVGAERTMREWMWVGSDERARMKDTPNG